MFLTAKAKTLRIIFQLILLIILVFCIYINVVADTELTTASRIEQAALERVGKTIIYDGTYQKIKYPMGDVADERGVCTDVVIRSFRKVGVDLQKLIHLDMSSNFKAYPDRWGLRTPDSNIDHRRVPNIRRYFERHELSLAVSDNPDDYKAGDIVSWRLLNNAPHIGIVISHKSVDGKRPLIVHNVGWGTKVDDYLFANKITGHYRFITDQALK